RFHQKFEHGVRVAWYRDVLRPRMLRTPSVENTSDKQWEIHALTRSVIGLISSGRSNRFIFPAAGTTLCAFTRMGSSSNSDWNRYGRHFPAARIILRVDAGAKLAEIPA